MYNSSSAGKLLEPIDREDMQEVSSRSRESSRVQSISSELKRWIACSTVSWVMNKCYFGDKFVSGDTPEAAGAVPGMFR